MMKQLGLLVASLLVVSCVGDDASSPQSAQSAQSAEGVSAEAVSAEAVISDYGWGLNVAGKPGDGVGVQKNCSIVQYCDRPNSPEGTVCLMQAGCTFQEAENECASESYTVCGSPKCPWILVDRAGVRYNHVDC